MNTLRDGLKGMTLKEVMAVVSFICGVILASICLFAVEPIGEIASSAISIVSELLILCGALLGVQASFDHKMNKFKTEFMEKLKDKEE